MRGLLGVLLLLAGSTARAQFSYPEDPEAERVRPSFQRLKISIRPWLSQGSGRFQIIFPFAPPLPQSEIAEGSTLEFRDDNNLMYVASVEARLHRRFSFDCEFAKNSFIGGESLDHDWIHAPNYNVTVLPSGNVYRQPDHVDDSLSRSALSGDTFYLATHAYFRVWMPGKDAVWREDRVYHFLDLFAGYSWYEDKFRMRNGVQLIANPDFIGAPLGPFNGHDSTYEFRWRGPRLGLREEVLLPWNLHASGRFAYSPSAEFRGEGVWNLRTDLRKDPSFRDSAVGSGLDAVVSLAFSPLRMASVELGYHWMRFTAHRGTARTFFSSGAVGEIELEEVVSERDGIFASLAFKF